MKIHRFTQKELAEEDRRIYRNNLKKERLKEELRLKKYGNTEKIKVLQYVQNSIKNVMQNIGVAI